MGNALSLEKVSSNFDDILNTNPSQFNRLIIENYAPSNIGFHLRMWKFTHDDSSLTEPISKPFQLQNMNPISNDFNQTDCVLILLVYKEYLFHDKENPNKISNFPYSLINSLPQLSNFRQDSLNTPVISSMGVEKLQRTMTNGGNLYQNEAEEGEEKLLHNKMHYVGFVWEGLKCSYMMKMYVCRKAKAFERYVSDCFFREKCLEIIFNGANFSKKGKIKSGTVLQQVSNTKNKFSFEHVEMIKNFRKNNLLLKILLAENDKKFKSISDFTPKGSPVKTSRSVSKDRTSGRKFDFPLRYPCPCEVKNKGNNLFMNFGKQIPKELPYTKSISNTPKRNYSPERLRSKSPNSNNRNTHSKTSTLYLLNFEASDKKTVSSNEEDFCTFNVNKIFSKNNEAGSNTDELKNKPNDEEMQTYDIPTPNKETLYNNVAVQFERISRIDRSRSKSTDKSRSPLRSPHKPRKMYFEIQDSPEEEIHIVYDDTEESVAKGSEKDPKESENPVDFSFLQSSDSTEKVKLSIPKDNISMPISQRSMLPMEGNKPRRKLDDDFIIKCLKNRNMKKDLFEHLDLDENKTLDIDELRGLMDRISAQVSKRHFDDKTGLNNEKLRLPYEYKEVLDRLADALKGNKAISDVDQFGDVIYEHIDWDSDKVIGDLVLWFSNIKYSNTAYDFQKTPKQKEVTCTVLAKAVEFVLKEVINKKEKRTTHPYFKDNYNKLESLGPVALFFEPKRILKTLMNNLLNNKKTVDPKTFEDLIYSTAKYLEKDYIDIKEYLKDKKHAKKLFDFFDTDSSGKLDKKEIRVAIDRFSRAFVFQANGKESKLTNEVQLPIEYKSIINDLNKKAVFTNDEIYKDMNLEDFTEIIYQLPKKQEKEIRDIDKKMNLQGERKFSKEAMNIFDPKNTGTIDPKYLKEKLEEMIKEFVGPGENTKTGPKRLPFDPKSILAGLDKMLADGKKCMDYPEFFDLIYNGNVNNKKDNECDKGKPDAKDDNSGKQADSLENDDLQKFQYWCGDIFKATNAFNYVDTDKDNLIEKKHLEETLDKAVKNFVKKKGLKDISKLPVNYKTILKRLSQLTKDEFKNIIEPVKELPINNDLAVSTLNFEVNLPPVTQTVQEFQEIPEEVSSEPELPTPPAEEIDPHDQITVTHGSIYKCDALKVSCKVEIIEEQNKLRMMACPKNEKIENPIGDKWSLIWVCNDYNPITVWDNLKDEKGNPSLCEVEMVKSWDSDRIKRINLDETGNLIFNKRKPKQNFMLIKREPKMFRPAKPIKEKKAPKVVIPPPPQPKIEPPPQLNISIVEDIILSEFGIDFKKFCKIIYGEEPSDDEQRLYEKANNSKKLQSPRSQSKKEAIDAIVNKNSKDDLKKAFDVLDTKKIGKIDFPQFKQLLLDICIEKLNLKDKTGPKPLPWTNEELEKFFSEIDQNKDKFIDFDEFCQATIGENEKGDKKNKDPIMQKLIEKILQVNKQPQLNNQPQVNKPQTVPINPSENDKQIPSKPDVLKKELSSQNLNENQGSKFSDTKSNKSKKSNPIKKSPKSKPDTWKNKPQNPMEYKPTQEKPVTPNKNASPPKIKGGLLRGAGRQLLNAENLLKTPSKSQKSITKKSDRSIGKKSKENTPSRSPNLVKLGMKKYDASSKNNKSGKISPNKPVLKVNDIAYSDKKVDNDDKSNQSFDSKFSSNNNKKDDNILNPVKNNNQDNGSKRSLGLKKNEPEEKKMNRSTKFVAKNLPPPVDKDKNKDKIKKSPIKNSGQKLSDNNFIKKDTFSSATSKVDSLNDLDNNVNKKDQEKNQPANMKKNPKPTENSLKDNPFIVTSLKSIEKGGSKPVGPTKPNKNNNTKI